MSLPGFLIAAILSFRFSWNEFVLPVVIANKPDSMIFQVALFTVHFAVQNRLGLLDSRHKHSYYSRRSFDANIPEENDQRTDTGRCQRLVGNMLLVMPKIVLVKDVLS